MAVRTERTRIIDDALVDITSGQAYASHLSKIIVFAALVFSLTSLSVYFSQLDVLPCPVRRTKAQWQIHGQNVIPAESTNCQAKLLMLGTRLS